MLADDPIAQRRRGHLRPAEIRLREGFVVDL